MLRADDIELQLAEPRPAAFTAPGWYFELKFDGFRLLAERLGGRVRLVLRRGREATALFPEVTAAVAALPGGDFILDGELVIQDAEGRPIFQRLLKRSTLAHRRDIEKAMRADPAVYFAFDLLMLDGQDLRGLALSQRKELLFRLLPKAADRVIPVEHVEAQGEAFLEAVRQRGLEGIVAKKADAPYRGGRGEAWLKIAFTRVWDFAVVGYTDDWNALHLATWDGRQFVYAGKVGSGITPKIAEAIKPVLLPRVRRTPPCAGDVPREKDVVWCDPELVVEVRYKNWPEGLSPREPRFLRFRDDKRPEECPSPKGQPAPAPADAEVAPEAEPATASGEVKISNEQKIFFPEDGITKGELVAYYRAVSPWLLPYFKDRPLMMTRYPDGIAGKSFFQKSVPRGAPAWVRSIRVRSEEEQRELDQIVCDDLRTLEWCVNLGAIPFHLPASRVASMDRADWCVIDFDPKGAPFAQVVTLANALHALCEKAGLPSFVKTTGSSGLHVYVPLGAQLDHAGAHQLAAVLAALLVQQHPAIATLERVVKQRAGRVYVDAVQNGPGKVVAAPLCVRPFAHAPVSMPLEWAEVTPELGARQFTVRDAVQRLEARGDPMAPVRTLAPDLAEAIRRLG